MNSKSAAAAVGSKQSAESNLTTFRRTFTIIAVFNLLFVIERTVFDFMGFMYGIIAADLIFLVFLIIGIFGAYQYRANYVVTTVLLSLLWIGWNLLIICNYLNIGLLDRYNPYILNINNGQKSWWFSSSFGCSKQITLELEQLQSQEQLNLIKNLIESSTNESTVTSTSTSVVVTSGITAKTSYEYMNAFIQTNCLLPFYTIEIMQAGLQIFLSIFLVIFGILLANAFQEDDDTFDYIGGFDTAQIIPCTYDLDSQQPTLPRNGQIRMEALYALNGVNFKN